MQFFRSCFRERGSPNGEDFYPQTRRFPAAILGGLQGEATQYTDKKTAQAVCNAYENGFSGRNEMKEKGWRPFWAALLAALPLTRSATYANLPEVVGCDALAEPDADVDAGKLIIVPGREGYRLGRAVNSLTTLTPDKAAPFQKIKIVEGIDLIRGDIAKAFESGYVGKVLNDYDNKLLLVTAINAYLKGLEGDVLDKTADNRCFVSLSGQRSYLESRGTDTSEMKDTDILKANTGSQVFLEAKLTFCDAMEDLALVISM